MVLQRFDRQAGEATEVYGDASYAVLGELVERAQERHERERQEREAARHVAVRRIGRAAGAMAGLLVGLAVFVCALAAVGDGGSSLGGYGDPGSLATYLLLCSWPVALVVGVAARIVAGRATQKVHAPIRLTGHAGADLVRLQDADALRDVRAMAARWERAGAALPLAALSIVTPLTLHFLVWSLIVGPGVAIVGFGDWIGGSVVLVGHAHIVLAACAAWWACSLHKRATSALRCGAGTASLKALAITAAVACVPAVILAAATPGVILAAVPPLLVALTGLVFVPAMYAATALRMGRERLAMEGIA
jgi:hypothetical protein